MLRTLHLSDKLRRSLLKSGITGEIGSHGAQTNLESIQRLLKQDPYVTFGIEAVNKAVESKKVTHTQMVEIMATALGISPERFHQAGAGYIDPQLTATKLGQMIDLITATAQRGGLFVLATAHPGSLVTYYLTLCHYIARHGGQVYRSPALVKIGEYRWIDHIEGVHVMSDEGNLLHTHDSQGFAQFLDQLPAPPDLVLADHGYAGAAINRGLKTIAIHDVDDPGLALAAHLGRDVLTIPMNDNQLNLPTAAALQAVLDGRLKP